MKSDSYSSPSDCIRDGAHRSARPWVPAAYPMTGRFPMPIHGVLGTSTVPDTAILAPVRSVET